MNPIVPPLKAGDRGDAVGNLQDALLLLIERAVIPVSQDERRSLTALLQRERKPTPERRAMGILRPRESEQPVYSEGTAKAVTLFQQNRWRPPGQVDEPTANALNAALRKLGVIPAGPSEATRPAQHEPTRPAQEAATRPPPRAQDETAAPGQGQPVAQNPQRPNPPGPDIPPRSEPVYEVKGTIRLADGYPASGLTVSAFDRDLRSEELLGRGTTDPKGFYKISYHPSQFAKREKGSADLAVKVFAADASLLATSPILFNAPPVAEIDIAIPAEKRLPPSLFEKIGRALQPLLDGVKVEELEEDARHQDMSFLSAETGYEKAVLVRFALAHKLAKRDLQPEFWFGLLGTYVSRADDNQSLHTQVATLEGLMPSLDAAAMRKVLAASFYRNEIAAVLRGKVDGWITSFLRFTASQVVRESKTPTFAKLALEHANIKTSEKQEIFASLFNEHRRLTPEFLAALRKSGSFKEQELADLRTSFRLADITQRDFSVVKRLKEDFQVRQPEKIRLLAKRSESDWVNWAKREHAAGQITLPIQVGDVAEHLKLPEAEIYGKTLERQFREAFPTTAFAGGLERALQGKSAKGLRQAERLASFLDAHEEFEFLNTSIDEFLGSVYLTKQLPGTIFTAVSQGHCHETRHHKQDL